MANEGFGALSTILSVTLTASAQTSTILLSKGAQRLFLYTTFTKSSNNLSDWHVEVSDDGGTTWFVEQATVRTTVTATNTWRTVVDLSVPGSSARQVRASATGASTNGTVVTTARFDHARQPVLVN